MAFEDEKAALWSRVYEREKDKLLDKFIESGYGDPTKIESGARYKADEAARDFDQRKTQESWDKIRTRIWQRDKGICDVCGQKVDPAYYECGHIVDRVCGGSDLDDNLVVMCVTCNRVLKQLHETKAEYEQWLVRCRKSIAFWALYGDYLNPQLTP